MRDLEQMINSSLTRLAIAAVLLSLTPAARAANDVTILADQAKILSVSGQPGTVVVGNPNIADVSVQGEQVVLVGRNFGVTNLIVLDRDGKQLAALDVTVQYPDKNAVHVFKAAGRMSLVCAPVCEQTLQVGDDLPRVFKPLAEEIGAKGDLANGATKSQ
jgi:Flp pilus assembly secretin CpaC